MKTKLGNTEDLKKYLESEMINFVESGNKIEIEYFDNDDLFNLAYEFGKWQEKQKHTQPEEIWYGDKWGELFKKAVKNACKKEMLSNESIFFKNEHDHTKVTIRPTQAKLLIEIGRQYEVLVSSEKEVQK